jgi:hypothetical protein
LRFWGEKLTEASCSELGEVQEELNIQEEGVFQLQVSRRTKDEGEQAVSRAKSLKRPFSPSIHL